MRLIDGAIQPMFLANYILERKDTFVRILEKGDNDFLFGVLMDYFDTQPTAYDVDAVVKQLEYELFRWKDSGEAYNDEKEKGVAIGFQKAIEIVKGGGVDAKTDT